MFECIINISIFEEDNTFSMTANLQYGPPMDTDIDCFWTFLLRLFVSFSMLAVRYLLGEEKPVLAL